MWLVLCSTCLTMRVFFFFLQTPRKPSRVSRPSLHSFLSAFLFSPVVTFLIRCSLFPSRTERTADRHGHPHRGGYHWSLGSYLVPASQEKSRLPDAHSVRVPPSVPGPGRGPLLPGGGGGDRQRAVGELYGSSRTHQALLAGWVFRHIPAVTNGYCSSSLGFAHVDE